MPDNRAEPPLSLAQAALARGDWEAARAAFQDAIADRETPEAHEGLSWAAWWLNEGDLSLRAREAAYRLYRQAGDMAGAARMAIWLATDHEDFRGEMAIARGWRQLARKLLADLPPAPEHGWLALLEGEAALLLDEDTPAALAGAREAQAAARQCAASDIAVLAVGLEGLALVCAGEVDAGMGRLDEAAASVLGGEVDDAGLACRVFCYLIYGCERVRDFGRAAEWCERMRDVADRKQMPMAQGICRAHYAGVLISRGRWSDAEATLSDAATLLSESRPPWAAEAFVRLADLRRRQGRLEEAEAILRRAEWHPWAALGRAEIALETGRLQDGRELVERFLRHVPQESRLQRAAALELLVRIAALSNLRARAAEALAELTSIADMVATPPLRAATRLSAAMVAVSAGAFDEARAGLEDAVDLFEQGGTPYEAARTRLELAAVLVELGRMDRAREEAMAAQRGLERLGATFSRGRAAALLTDIDRRAGRSSPRAGAGADAGLTPRQIEILRLVSQGCSDRDVAARLGVSEHTVHRHMANILLRLDAPTRAAAAAQAAGRGLI